MHLGELGFVSQVCRVTSEQPLTQKMRAAATIATSAKAFTVYRGSLRLVPLTIWRANLLGLDGR